MTSLWCQAFINKCSSISFIKIARPNFESNGVLIRRGNSGRSEEIKSLLLFTVASVLIVLPLRHLTDRS